MTDQRPPIDNGEFQPRMSDQKRAFLEYKKRVGESGKPFMPYGVWHDLIAAVGVMAIIIALSTVWFAQANCDSLWNVSCDRVSTPLEQEHYTPDEPGVVLRDDDGEAREDVAHPKLGLLYEEKADPATTSYHPRPEWYFYFLFYLLILFSNPQLMVFGTIIVPTLWLVMLLAWPFIDRRPERRPSRRPVAMAAMVLTAITLLSFSYLGSQSGKEATGGPEGLTEEQVAMPGYNVLFEEGIFETCGSCHVLGGLGNGSVGPDLTEVGPRYDDVDEMLDVMLNGLGGGAMPPKGGTGMSDEQAAQVAAFLKTLGDPGAAADLADYGQADVERVAGGTEGGTENPSSEGEATSEDAQGDTNDASGEADPAAPNQDATNG
ncbi:MAG: Cytochrome b subunit of the bc complex-like protein [Thermoleophilia bacterium]|nr:Cytochrome b subunit of the bc complex-like protein [Thermoleophilia bacterium]